MKTESLYLRISPNKIYYLKFILEGYDGLAALSTIDPEKGIVVLRYSREWSRDLFELLASLVPELRTTA